LYIVIGAFSFADQNLFPVKPVTWLNLKRNCYETKPDHFIVYFDGRSVLDFRAGDGVCRR
jgi:hypothetical protein